MKADCHYFNSCYLKLSAPLEDIASLVSQAIVCFPKIMTIRILIYSSVKHTPDGPHTLTSCPLLVAPTQFCK